MELVFKLILAFFLILIVVLAYTLFNIYQFMPNYAKCQSGFQIINRCNCIPDEGLSKLFNFTTSKNINLSDFK